MPSKAQIRNPFRFRLLLPAVFVLLSACSGGGGGTPQPPAVSVALNPGSASLVPGASQSFQATVSNASNTAVAWTVDGTTKGNASVGTITGTGTTVTYTAPATAGSHSIEATSDSGRRDRYR